MKFINLEEINKIRNKGFRPQIVGCFLNNKKILFLYKKKHDLWQFPQGGIENNETINNAFFRETKEELGEEFVEACDKNIFLIGEDKIIFPLHNQNSRELKNNAGKSIFMKGKKYFFIGAKTKANFNVFNSEFDDFRWTSFKEAIALCDKIYQAGKKRITVNALKQLRSLNLL
jgi:putative (di)nucleoside polyphosphate hydrolase